MKRVMLYVLAFLIYGILLGQYASSNLYIVFFMLFPVLATGFLFYKFRRKEIFLFIFISIIGVILINNGNQNFDSQFLNLAKSGENIKICAYIKENGKSKNGKIKLIVKTKYIEIENQKIEGKYKAILYTENNKESKIGIAGETIIFNGKVFIDNRKTNPYDFDYQKYYKARKISFTGYGQITKIIGINKNCDFYFQKIRDSISAVYDKILPQKYAEILKAMIIGDKTGLFTETTQIYSVLGIYHLLVVSGLHFAVIVSALVFITDRFNKQYGKIAVIIMIILYSLIVGDSPATTRAVIMATIVLSRYIVLKSDDFLTSTSVACILILCFEPNFLFDVGFQYSFVAVFSIGLLCKPICDRFSDKIEKSNSITIINSVISTIIICMAIKPITAYYFYKVSNFDIFANILILPLMSIVIICGMLSGIIGFISIPIAKFIVVPAYLIYKFIDAIGYAFSKVPFAYMITGKISLIVVFGFYSFLIAIAFCVYEKRILFKNRILFFLIGLIVFTSCLSFDMLSKDKNKLKITILDVGQGDSIIGSYKNFDFIIDGGGSLTKELGNDSGINTVLPQLNGMGINRVEAVFISHNDADHIKGIIEIIGKIKIDKIYISKAKEENEFYFMLIEKAKKNNIPIIEMEKDDYLKYDKLELKCIYPTSQVIDNKIQDGNNGSIVIKVIFGDKSFLFTGDIGQECEKQIIKDKIDVKADVLKLAHHGSKNSNSEEFLKAVNPIIAIASTGKNNRYNHPSEEVKVRLEEIGIKLYNTADNGAVLIESDGKKIWVKSMIK